MIFIKNFSNEANSSFGIRSERAGDETNLSLIMADGSELLSIKSSIPGLSGSIRRSIEGIGKATNTLEKSDTAIASVLYDDKPTEIAVYIKDQKVALVQGDGDKIIPINVEVVPNETDEEGKPKKRYPRDMVIIIVDKPESGDTRLVCDDRNLATKPIVATLDKFQVIFAMVKWPIWSNLKFPVYMYVEQGENIIGAIQLGSRTENKITKNQIEDVDAQTAKDYLDESAKILQQRAERGLKRNNTNNRSNGGNQKRQYNNDNKGKGGQRGNGKKR